MDATASIITMSDIAMFVGYIINVIWLGIIAIGVLKATVSAIIDEFHILQHDKPVSALMHVRRNLAIYLLLWLEFVVAADIINTMIHFDLNNLLLLWLLVAIRIVIWYTLEKEIITYEKDHPAEIQAEEKTNGMTNRKWTRTKSK